VRHWRTAPLLGTTVNALLADFLHGFDVRTCCEPAVARTAPLGVLDLSSTKGGLR
jgi:hypothetical protein